MMWLREMLGLISAVMDDKIKMKIIVTVIFVAFFAIVAKPQGMVLSTAYNTNSTEGNFFGTWNFSFSTNDFTPNNNNNNASNMGMWGTTSCSMSFTDAASGSIILLNFQVGGIENANSFGVRSSININDPNYGAVAGGIGDGGGNQNQESTTLIYPGKSANQNNNQNQDSFFFYSWNRGVGGNGQVNLTESITFDGVNGAGGGTWAVVYPVPEPATVLQFAAGGLCLCAAGYFRRRRK